MRRILLATWGSGGDVAPLLPIAEHLHAEGHEVRLLVPRSLGLYLRTTRIRLPAVNIGDGSEMAFARDDRLFTTRCFGWSSYRRVFSDYLAPRLQFDVLEATRVLRSWQPDVVVTTTYAVPARIAALHEGIPHVACSIYPQFAALNDRAGHCFSAPYLSAVRGACSAPVLERFGLELVAWGVDPSGVLLHDPALLGTAEVVGGGTLVGFTYFDELAASDVDLELALEWMGRSDDVVVVTLGSFISLVDNPLWEAAIRGVRRCGCRALLLNAGRGMASASTPENGAVLAVGYVPLSRIAANAAAVIHHGGIGTSFGALRAGRPAIVMPQAFDQPFNAQLLTRADAGLASSATDLVSDVDRLLSTDRYRTGARVASQQLIPTRVAATTAAEMIVRRAGV